MGAVMRAPTVVAPTAVVVGILLASCARKGGDEPWFEDRAAQAGIDFRHASGHEGRHLMPEIMGGGAALGDYDGDGDLDIYLVQSGHITKGSGLANRLYINVGAGRFEPASSANGAADTGYGMGAATGDYDNDGDLDIYVTNLGPNALLRNDGAGNFENVAQVAGVDEPGWGTAATFIDADLDGDLDLFLVNYITWSPGIEMDCYVGGKPAYCSPQNYRAPAVDHLYRNNGDGTFTDVSDVSGFSFRPGNGLGVLGADFDGDDRVDLFVANDMTFNHLWLNRGGLQFQEAGMAWGVAVDENGSAKAGMGVAAGDIDDDSDLDLMVVNLVGQTDSFFVNQGGSFADATRELGLGILPTRFTRFGVVLADFDNDGWLDVYEGNGCIIPDCSDGADPYAEPNVLFKGLPVGGFAEVKPDGGTAAVLKHTTRAVAVGDLDDDGGLDLVVVNRDAETYILMNEVAAGTNWVRFRVIDENGLDAYGAAVYATVGSRRLRRDVQAAGSYLAANDPRVHFGLGASTTATAVEVEWPDGGTESFGDFDAGRTALLRRGEGR